MCVAFILFMTGAWESEIAARTTEVEGAKRNLESLVRTS
jgi:hypothetical protein